MAPEADALTQAGEVRTVKGHSRTLAQVGGLVDLHLADELPAVGSQACEDGVDVVDCECEMAEAQGVRPRIPDAAMDPRGVKLHQLEPSVAVGGVSIIAAERRPLSESGETASGRARSLRA